MMTRLRGKISGSSGAALCATRVQNGRERECFAQRRRCYTLRLEVVVAKVVRATGFSDVEWHLWQRRLMLGEQQRRAQSRQRTSCITTPACSRS